MPFGPRMFKTLLMLYASMVNPTSPAVFLNPLSSRYPWLKALFIVPKGCSTILFLALSFQGSSFILNFISSTTSACSHRHTVLPRLFRVHFVKKKPHEKHAPVR